LISTLLPVPNCLYSLPVTHVAFVVVVPWVWRSAQPPQVRQGAQLVAPELAANVPDAQVVQLAALEALV
jgi:hypothetical protein